jgi:AcrR family transcriptional regulator
LNEIVRQNIIFAFSNMEMDPAAHGIDKYDKVKLIIEASQKRFGIYGVEKTSMREIADDLKISKASLYYYFPDKESLYKAVVEKEQNEFIVKISERISDIDEPEQLLLEYSNARLSYFRTLLNLSRLRLETFSDMKPGFMEAIRNFREKEKEIIKRIFQKGISSGVFTISDTDSTAELFLDLLKGLRISLLNQKQTLFIEQAEYDMLLEKTLTFTDHFIKGLKYKKQNT